MKQNSLGQFKFIKLKLYLLYNIYQMTTNSGLNHLIMKRIGTSFSKGRDLQNKQKKINDRIIVNNMEGISFNLSVDVKNHMTKQKQQFIKHRPNNTLNLQLQSQKAKRKNKLLFFNYKRDLQGSNEKSLKLAYGNSSPKAIKQRVNIYTSQKSIKQKRKQFSLSTNVRGQSELLQHPGSDSSDHNNHKHNQTVNMEKHMVISKYQKIKHLLKQQKYSQASIYLKQIIPYIEDKNKKKQLYFWLVASLMKSNSQSKMQNIQSYIVECLEQFPNFYDIYLYWGKIKIILDQKQDAFQIYEKAIGINNQNSQAYLELATMYIKSNNKKQALQILKEGFANSLNSISIPMKIIQNYKLFQLLLDSQIQPYLERIQSNCGKKSTQFLYILGFIQKAKHNCNQALIYFLESLKYNSNKNFATKSLECLIRIHISKKDFYAAFYDLKRAKYLNIDVKKIDKYEIFLEGANFVMKKQNQEGIKMLSKIKQISTKITSKKRINSFVSINSAEDNKISFADDPQILSLAIKYLAYAYFKLGNHKQSIKYYKYLQKVDNELDKTSKYNMLLAEGIVLADFYQDFQAAMIKFQEAKAYLLRVDPWIYQSVVTIQKQVHFQKQNYKNKLMPQTILEEELNSSIIQALNIMQEGFQVNISSSNLLYHRTILHLYFSSLKSAMQDINVCIQRAQQNLPKYFYLRGICFACMKNLKKAINEFSISISLSKQYSISYLQRAKCYFLSGQTQMGFQDLKFYMDQCPNDSLVHKWIGDLLFEGTSYSDCIKAYNEMGIKITLQALCMKIKAQIRVCTIKQIAQTVNLVKLHPDFNNTYFAIDIAAYELLSVLVSPGGNFSHDKDKHIKQIEKRVKELNEYLQGDDIEKGMIFNLVDCMFLIGIGNFYSEKYLQAYESFLLVLEFLKSTKIQILSKSNLDSEQNQVTQQEPIHKQKLNTQFQQQNFDLREQDVYFNMFICLLAFKDFQSIKKMTGQEMISMISNKTQRKVIDKIVSFLNEHNLESKISKNQSNSISIFQQNKNKNSSKLKLKKQNLMYYLEPRIQNPLNLGIKKVELVLPIQKQSLTIKTSLILTSYHGSNENLNFTTMAKKLVNQLHAGYIDNMPQGPWIRRNQFGVLFTDNILDEGNQSSFITTNRPEQKGQQQNYEKEFEQYDENYDFEVEEQEGEKHYKQLKGKQKEKIEDRKKAFLKEMKLDLRVQNKLNKILKKE